MMWNENENKVANGMIVVNDWVVNGTIPWCHCCLHDFSDWLRRFHIMQCYCGRLLQVGVAMRVC